MGAVTQYLFHQITLDVLWTQVNEQAGTIGVHLFNLGNKFNRFTEVFSQGSAYLRCFCSMLFARGIRVDRKNRRVQIERLKIGCQSLFCRFYEGRVKSRSNL